MLTCLLFLLPTTTRLHPSFSILCCLTKSVLITKLYWLHLICDTSYNMLPNRKGLLSESCPEAASTVSHVLCLKSTSDRQWEVGTTSFYIFRIKGKPVQIRFHFQILIQRIVCLTSTALVWTVLHWFSLEHSPNCLSAVLDSTIPGDMVQYVNHNIVHKNKNFLVEKQQHHPLYLLLTGGCHQHSVWLRYPSKAGEWQNLHI